MGNWEQPPGNGGIYSFYQLKFLYFQDLQFREFPKFASERREFKCDWFSIWTATTSNGIHIIFRGHSRSTFPQLLDSYFYKMTMLWWVKFVLQNQNIIPEAEYLLDLQNSNGCVKLKASLSTTIKLLHLACQS